jgi:antitoxin MazE
LTFSPEKDILGLYIGENEMPTKIQKWGNSQGLRIPRGILEKARISVGDEVEILLEDDVIVVRPIKRIRGRYNLAQLLAEIPENYTAEELDWEEARGREAW